MRSAYGIFAFCLISCTSGLSGPPGPSGEQGESGPVGVMGTMGNRGLPGPAGNTGPAPTVTPLAPGNAACPAGGTQISGGDGTSAVVCNGVTPGYAMGAGLTLSGGTIAANFPPAGPETGTTWTVARGDHVHDGRYQQKPITTIFVGPSGTPVENGVALLAAVASIRDNTSAKPYVIHLEPGVYDLMAFSYVGKPWVDLEGSGPDVTRIQGYPTSALVTLTAPSEVRELTAIHMGSTPTATAVALGAGVMGSIVARRVVASATGATNTTVGISVVGEGEAIVEDSTLAAFSTGGFSLALSSTDPMSTLKLRRDQLRASNTYGFVYGISSRAGTFSAEACELTAYIGSSGAGISLSNSNALLRAVNVSVSVPGAWASAVSATYGKLAIEGGSYTTTATGSAQAVGLSLTGLSWKARNTQVQVNGTTASPAVGIGFSSSASALTGRLDRGGVVVSNGTVALLNGSSGGTTSVNFAGSQLAGSPPQMGSGCAVHCVTSYDGNDNALGSSCL